MTYFQLIILVLTVASVDMVQGNCLFIPVFANGQVSCTNGSAGGSVCSFVCNEHFTLVGNPFTACSFNVWDRQIPNCVYTSCSVISSIDNGNVTCTNDNHLNSRCMFQCFRGYYLDGDSVLECVAGRQWNKPLPTCIAGNLPVACDPPISNLFRSPVSCTDGSNLDSVCEVECQEYNVPGMLAFKCGNPDQHNRGIWSKNAVTCGDAGGIYDNGLTTQTPLDTIACDRAYVDVLFLLDGSVGEQAFRTQQDTLTAITYNLRSVIYPGSMWLAVAQAGSTCGAVDVSNFQINIDLGKQNVSLFNNQVRGWKVENNTCTTLQESLFKSRQYIMGRARRLAVKIVVLFLFQQLNVTSQQQVSQFASDGVKLMILASDPSHLQNINSSQRLMFSGSGVQLYAQLPTISSRIKYAGCPELGCPMTFVNFTNGTYACAYARGVGTVCEFYCDAGATLIGFDIIRCDEINEKSSTEWNHPPPICTNSTSLQSFDDPTSSGTCPSISAVENGGFNCSTSNLIGSQCVFRCNTGYFIHGPGTITCQDEGTNQPTWSGEFPVCATDLLCYPVLEAPENGQLTCPDGNHFNTQCTVTCNDGYLPVGSTKLKCNQPRPDGGATWDSTIAHCTVCNVTPCQVDIMVAIDASGRLTPEDFSASKAWLMSVWRAFQGEVDIGMTNLAAMQYGGKATFTCDSGSIRKDVKLIFGEITRDSSTVEEKLSDASQIRGCPTPGNGVKLASEYLVGVGRSSARKVLILLTGSTDDDELTSRADCAKAQGLTLIAVGVGGASPDRITEIASTPEMAYTVDSFQDLPGFQFDEMAMSIRNSGRNRAMPSWFSLLCALLLSVTSQSRSRPC